MKPRTLAPIVLAAALAVLGTPGTRAQYDDSAVVDDFTAGDFGRVRVAENGATVLRGDADRARDDRLGINSPVFPGDLVRTGRDQRVEVELAGGSLVRMDHDTALNFQALPDPYAEHPDNTVLTIDFGSLQIHARPSSKEEFRIDTPAASVYLVGDGEFRIDVDEGGHTSVLSRRGVAEVVGNDGSVLVRAGLLTEVSPGGDPYAPRRFNVYNADAFDRWTAARDAVARQWDADDDLAADDLPYTVRPYYRELSAYGNWAYEPTYGHVWYPDSVGVGWRPYYDGYWSYSPRGYFWISNEPWGWAPYHYGRWVYVNNYGWGWCPGRIFAGAWVSWSWGSAYIGWAPLSYWNYPAYYHTTLYHGYYDPHCWSFVRYDHFAHHDYHRYYVPVKNIHHHIGGNAVVTRPPRVAPHAIVRDAALRERTWRDVKAQKVGRVAPVQRDAKPTARFVDAEDRVVRSGAVRKATEVRRAKRTPERVERQGGNPDRVSERPRRLTTQDEVNARPTRSLDVRGSGRGSNVRSVERPRPSGADTGRGRTDARPAERPRPTDDADRGRSNTRSVERPRPSAGDTSRGRTDARPAERPRPTDDADRGRSSTRSVERPRPQSDLRGNESDASRRLRNLYRDAGRPVEPQRPRSSEAQRDREQDRGRSPEAGPAERPRPQPRAEPRREAPRPQPRAEPQREAPRPQPRAEPRREAPRPQPRNDDGGRRAAPKKDDGGGSKSKGDSDRGGGRGRGR